MMGLPSDYVGKPGESRQAMNLASFCTESLICYFLVKELFETLLSEAAYLNIFQFQRYWKDTLDPKYHVFSGNFHSVNQDESFKLYAYEGLIPEFELQLATPQTNQTVRGNICLSFSFCNAKLASVV